MGQETTFSNHISDNVLISKKCKEFPQCISKKANSLIKKMGKGLKQTYLQRRHRNGQQVYENMLNVTNHQANTSQNHKERLPHNQDVYNENTG